MSKKIVAFRWVYNSPAGEVCIQHYDAQGAWKYGIYFGDQCEGGYSRPEDAADNVACHATGISEVDALENPPDDLTAWAKVPIFERE